jgi:tripartite ATP-independent transporter DctM subunit
MDILTLIVSGVIFFALIETPLFTVIAGLSVASFYFINKDFSSVQTIIIEMNRLASMPVLVALPLFTLTGCLLAETGAPRRIMNIMRALTCRLPGGIAIAALISCALFTALTGASGVTIVALGGVLYPVLREQEYKDNFSLGLLTTSGSLGLLFAPSLPVILYGVVARVDIGVIFKGALIPGLLLIIILSAYSFFHEYLQKNREKDPLPKKAILYDIKTAVKEGIWDWPIVIVIITGVYGGFVTIAEVSALVLVYVLIVECLILKEIDFFQQLPGIIVESAIVSGAIIVILGVALGFTGYLVDEELPNRILSFLVNLTENKLIFLAGLNLFLLAAGCLMDIFSAIIIIVPIIVPVAMKYGIDPVHLCVIFLLNLEIGYSTPPVGINLFIASLKFNKPVTQLYRASFPYLVLMILFLMVVTYVPELSLMLVR